MALFFIVQMPSPEGTGKGMALRKVVGGGTAGADAYLEVDVTQPDNAVGQVLVSVPYAGLPTAAYSAITGIVDIAAEFLVLVNTTAVMRTAFVRTQAGTPLPLFDGIDLPPGIHMFPLYGIEFLDGLEWKAGGTGVYGAFKGYKELP